MAMHRSVLGFLLALLMFGHGFVLNQPQVLQSEFQHIHNILVPQFNLLYSIPSAVAIFFILPLGILYDSHSHLILLGAGVLLVLGQLLVTAFGTNASHFAFWLMAVGRVMEGTAA
jgi:MFS family permease